MRPENQSLLSIQILPDHVQRARPLLLYLADQPFDLHLELATVRKVGAIRVLARQAVKRDQELDQAAHLVGTGVLHQKLLVSVQLISDS